MKDLEKTRAAWEKKENTDAPVNLTGEDGRVCPCDRCDPDVSGCCGQCVAGARTPLDV